MQLAELHNESVVLSRTEDILSSKDTDVRAQLVRAL